MKRFLLPLILALMIFLPISSTLVATTYSRVSQGSNKVSMPKSCSIVPPSPDYPGTPPQWEPSDLGPLPKIKDPGPILLILIDFFDQPGVTPPAYYDGLMFGNSFGQMRNYWLEVSYGILDIYGQIAPGGWYRSASWLVWWGADGFNPVYGWIDCFNDAIFNLAREAVQLADVNIDFSLFDTNHNHVIDPDELFLAIVHGGPGEESTGNPNDIWSHSWYIGGPGWPDPYTGPGAEMPLLIVDGCRMSNDGYDPNDYTGGYVMMAENSPMGTFAHEFGHALGLPDLYDYTYTSFGVGRWCLMAAGSWCGPPVPGGAGTVPCHPSAYCKIQLDWVHPTTLYRGQYMNDAPVPQAETNPVAYKLVHSLTEYFLIENREKTGYDTYLRGSGLVIYHVDETMHDNDDRNHKMVDVEEAHGGQQNLDFYPPALGANSGDAYDPFYSPVKKEFTDTTDPNCTAYHSITKLWVTDVSAAGPSMTADLLSPTIGGEWAPMYVATLPATWISLGSTVALATVSVVFARYKKKQHN